MWSKNRGNDKKNTTQLIMEKKHNWPTLVVTTLVAGWVFDL